MRPLDPTKMVLDGTLMWLFVESRFPSLNRRLSKTQTTFILLGLYALLCLNVQLGSQQLI